jgi:hypothetical protein
MKKKKLKKVDPLLAAPVQADKYWTENVGDFPQRGKPNSITYTRSAETGCLLAPCHPYRWLRRCVSMFPMKS